MRRDTKWPWEGTATPSSRRSGSPSSSFPWPGTKFRLSVQSAASRSPTSRLASRLRQSSSTSCVANHGPGPGEPVLQGRWVGDSGRVQPRPLLVVQLVGGVNSVYNNPGKNIDQREREQRHADAEIRPAVPTHVQRNGPVDLIVDKNVAAAHLTTAVLKRSKRPIKTLNPTKRGTNNGQIFRLKLSTEPGSATPTFRPKLSTTKT